MAQSRASKGLLLTPRTNPTESGDRRARWLTDAETAFVSPSKTNQQYYSVILRALWPEGHGIPGPILSESDIRATIDNYRAKHDKKPYMDVFRRMRELQGEEGFTSIVKEGTRYQLQSLQIRQKREPRAKLARTQWKKIKEQFGFRCANCGEQEPAIKLSPDHKIPRSRNGSNDLGNWQPLCEQCNNIKSNTCRGCDLNCHVCSWAFPQDYKQLIITDDNKELIKRAADTDGVLQSDLVNNILRQYFNRR